MSDSQLKTLVLSLLLLFVPSQGSFAVGGGTSTCNPGSQWQVVDQVRRPGLRDSGAAAVVAVSHGVFALGDADFDRYRSTWFVRRSNDRGGTWHTTDEYPLGQLEKDAHAVSIASDERGDLYVLGEIRLEEDERAWVVRKGTHEGRAWRTVDYFRTGASDLRPEAIAAGPSGVYAVGRSRGEWIVRRSVNGGEDWSVVDRYKPRGGAGATAVAVSREGVYVGGISYSIRNGGIGTWLVRMSPNGRSHWKSVDEFRLDPYGTSAVQGAGPDGQGGVIFVGRAMDAKGRFHGVARRKTASGWVTLDDLCDAGVHASVSSLGVAAHRSGEIFITGGKTDSIASSDGVFHTYLTTRRGKLAAGFVESDAIFTDIPGRAMGVAVSADGDVFTVGKISVDGESAWIVRKLACE